jgi:dihydrofolate synthase / folylpolyglutamate synthase
VNAELRYLESLLASGIRPGLGRMRAFLAAAGRPERAVPAVLVAGTNGKGSTAATLESICRAAGYRTGLYTSPHLVTIRERWQLDGEPVGMRELRKAIARLRDADSQIEITPTYFEALTLVAFILFEQTDREIAILEVGMGGRLDATNVVRPLASVIASIGLDHTEWLGRTVRKIAAEKAGVIHRGSVAVTSARDPAALEALEKRASRLDVPFHSLHGECRISRIDAGEGGVAFTLECPGERLRLESPLAGRHQVENVALAARTAQLIRSRLPRLDRKAIARGVSATRWRGRLELLTIGDSRIWVDGAHNLQAAERVASFVAETLPPPRTLVFGVLRDKQYEAIAGLLFPLFDRVILTEPDSERALGARDALAQLSPRFEVPMEAEPRPRVALRKAIRDGGTILVCGSLYLAGEAIATLDRLAAVLGKERPSPRSGRASSRPIPPRSTRGGGRTRR